MKYIKKVILENFQSHKYTEMEFDKNLNVIVGPSDQGKSAIIRGIKWALFNEPSGDFFIREGESECSVIIEFSDNTKIKRYRSKTRNAYYLYDENGDEIIFEGFGTNVPHEIMDKTLIRKVVLDGSRSNAINIGEQLEGPFLLSEKNSIRANAIGRLVGVHIIDDALKDTLRDGRNLNIKKKSYETNLEKLKENLKEYDYLDKLSEKISQLENIRLEIHDKETKLVDLIRISKKLQAINAEILKIHNYLEKMKNLEQIMEIEKQLIEKINFYNSINRKSNRLNSINIQINEDKKTLNELKNIESCEKTIGNIETFSTKLNKLKKLQSNYRLLMKNKSKTNYQLKLLADIDIVENNFATIEKSYQKYNNLLRLNRNLSQINKSLSLGTIYIDKLSKIDYISNMENEICEKNQRLKSLMVYNNRYESISKAYTIEKKQLERLNEESNKYLMEYKNLLNEIKVCPLCFSNIDKTRIDEIINNYR
ncbi:MAG: AAA family ATPase [Tissierellia bacterium]|nr:AAA family ATPase [Tissierellia bacterium]